MPFETETHFDTPASRRDFLRRAGSGCGGLALAALLAEESVVRPTEGSPAPDSARLVPHVPARAKSVIWCFLDGGPSHIDLFDPKPALNELAGEPLPPSFKRPVTAMGRTAYTPIMASRRTFARYGNAGTWVSDWYPEIAGCVDDIAVIRCCRADGLNHVGSVCQMNTGSILGGRPCLGSWAAYGLGSETQQLPSFVVLLDYPQEPPGGSRNWGTGFMPARFQGTRFRDGRTPILHLQPTDPLSTARQRSELDFIQQLNRRHQQRERLGDNRLEARIAAYELAFRMQSSAREAVELEQETAETQRLYGLDEKQTRRNGRNCLLARRLVERGVRFVQLYMGAGSKWDAHSKLESNHGRYCRESDRPIAGLLHDLKRRGLLDETLVVWGGEFGRTPMSESGDGRDHNPYGFTMWMAGGGIQGGVTYGATDEIGLYVTEGQAHVHDIHATILDSLGLDHKQLTFFHQGRDERLTQEEGHVIEAILA